MRIGFFTKFSEPVIIRLFFYTIVGKSLFDRNTFRSFLTLGDDGQPVCTANVVGCLIHDSSTSSKKLLVFLCSLEYRIKALTIQGVGFDAYWKVLIIRDLLDGTKRFGEIKKSVGNVSQKVLTANLRSMEDSGLLTRKVYPEVPPRVEYTLTQTGYSLKPILDAMVEWGTEYKKKNS